MGDNRVTVRVNEQGEVAGIEVDGQLDPDEFVEEMPGKPPLLPTEDETGIMRFTRGD